MECFCLQFLIYAGIFVVEKALTICLIYKTNKQTNKKITKDFLIRQQKETPTQLLLACSGDALYLNNLFLLDVTSSSEVPLGSSCASFTSAIFYFHHEIFSENVKF